MRFEQKLLQYKFNRSLKTQWSTFIEPSLIPSAETS